MSELDKLRNQAANARLVHLNEQVVGPLLESKVKQSLDSVCHAFKFEGKIDQFKIAYIVALKDLQAELESVARNGDKAALKL